MKVVIWLVFAAIALVGGLYVPQWVAKALLFRSGISNWGWELLPSIIIGPPLALAVYALLFCWMKQQSFASRCMVNAVGGIALSAVAVVIILGVAN